jgi:hypothetical protein
MTLRRMLFGHFRVELSDGRLQEPAAASASPAISRATTPRGSGLSAAWAPRGGQHATRDLRKRRSGESTGTLFRPTTVLPNWRASATSLSVPKLSPMATGHNAAYQDRRLRRRTD